MTQNARARQSEWTAALAAVKERLRTISRCALTTVVATGWDMPDYDPADDWGDNWAGNWD